MANVDSFSKIGVHVVPLFTVFQRFPDPTPPSNVEVSAAGTVMLSTRPPSIPVRRRVIRLPCSGEAPRRACESRHPWGLRGWEPSGVIHRFLEPKPISPRASSHALFGAFGNYSRFLPTKLPHPVVYLDTSEGVATHTPRFRHRGASQLRVGTHPESGAVAPGSRAIARGAARPTHAEVP